jgi:hypothetical protein
MSGLGVAAYGHARCCGCEAVIDMAGRLHSLSIKAGNDQLYVFFCGPCAQPLELADEGACRALFEAAWSLLRANPQRVWEFATLTQLALLEHDFDPVLALELGTSLPRGLIEQIQSGRADLTKVEDVLLVVSEA